MNWNQLNSVEQWNAMLESEEKFIAAEEFFTDIFLVYFQSKFKEF